MTILQTIREKKPLIHHITNWVTIYDCAQATRAIGALPVMAHAEEEVEEMTNLASALVLNIGTLTIELINSMIKAAKKANAKKIPVILDAVGCGATKLRTESTLRILQNVRVDILKGNVGEIGIIAGAQGEVRGVESMGVAGNIVELAKNLANRYNNIVVVTGKVDIITDGKTIKKCTAGHAMMSKVVGTGCMAASVLGCFVSVATDYLEAAETAMNFYGQAGEKAAATTKRPMEFKINLIDNLAE